MGRRTVAGGVMFLPSKAVVLVAAACGQAFLDRICKRGLV
jgi:hypothetical protein